MPSVNVVNDVSTHSKRKLIIKKNTVTNIHSENDIEKFGLIFKIFSIDSDEIAEQENVVYIYNEALNTDILYNLSI